MKTVLIARPDGPCLYELSDDEFDRFEYLLELASPEERGDWASRFLAEREPAQTFPPGTLGSDELEGIEIDRAVGGNFFTPKWGRIRDGRTSSTSS